jgi:hypothetical protein
LYKSNETHGCKFENKNGSSSKVKERTEHKIIRDTSIGVFASLLRLITFAESLSEKIRSNLLLQWFRKRHTI